jgi:hypothetical protein
MTPVSPARMTAKRQRPKSSLQRSSRPSKAGTRSVVRPTQEEASGWEPFLTGMFVEFRKKEGVNLFQTSGKDQSAEARLNPSRFA